MNREALRRSLPAVKCAALAAVWTAILGWLVPQAMLLSRLDSRSVQLSAVRYLAVVPLVLGIVMCVSAIWGFAAIGRGTPAPFDPPRHLVMQGIFRYVRNPIYVGSCLIVVSEAILLQALTLPVIFWLAVVFAAVHLLVVLYEEPVLKKKFGAEYEQYLKHVPRWIPCLK